MSATGCTRALALVAVVAAMLTFTSSAAAAPANDNFANAIGIGPAPAQVTGTNIEATRQANEPTHGDFSVWWKWTAAASGRYRVDVCQTLPSMSSNVAVYTGSAVNSLQDVTAVGGGSGPISYNNGRCADGSLTAVAFDAVAGTTYRIAVAGGSCCSPYTSSNIVLNLKKSEANDNFDEATDIGTVPATVTGRNIDATRETSEPTATGSSTIWWKWTATASGRYRADVCNSLPSFSSSIGIYTGSSVAALTNATAAGAGDVDAPLYYYNGGCADGNLSAAVFDAVAGQTYYIAVGGGSCCSPYTSSNVVLKVAKSAVNDNFAEALTLASALPVSTTGSNVGASREQNEPTASGESSIWWSWTATKAGPVSVAVCRSNPSFASAVSVFTGAAVGQLAAVTTESVGCPTSGSRVTFNAIAGTTYRFAVGGGSCCSPYTSPNVTLDIRDVDCDAATSKANAAAAVAATAREKAFAAKREAKRLKKKADEQPSKRNKRKARKAKRRANKLAEKADDAARAAAEAKAALAAVC